MKFIILFFSIFITTSSFAGVDEMLVSKAERYLNSIVGLSGEFNQVANGKKSSGVFSMLRPGRVRLDYKKLPIQLISNGKDLYFYDKSLDQITTVPLTSTPAGILVRPNIDLINSDIKVSNTSLSDDSFWLTMNIKDQEGIGYMKVEFYNAPIRLKSWIVHDATGTDTVVEFVDLRTKTEFPRNFFELQKMKTSTTSGDSFYE